MSAVVARELTKTFVVPDREKNRGLRSFFFPSPKRTIHAVESVSFSIQPGELVAFLGPNGAGKTTTLKMLSGLLHPSSGDASVLGYTPWKRQRAFQKQFTMVMGQRTQLWWDLPAWDTLKLNKEIFEISDAAFKETIDELVDLLEIRDLLHIPVKKLSLGQRMKAEFACSLLHRPTVLLLDEPTIGLDVLMQAKLRRFIKDYNRRYQATILLTSHNMEDISELCSRILVINHGKLLIDEPMDTFLKRHPTQGLTEAVRDWYGR